MAETLLVDLEAGREGALERLLPIVYEELRALAANYLQNDRGTPMLQPTSSGIVAGICFGSCRS